LKNVKFKWFEKTLWFVLSSLIAVLLLSIAFYFFIKKI
jgi:membrane-bound ClpP family serine protease